MRKTTLTFFFFSPPRRCLRFPFDFLTRHVFFFFRMDFTQVRIIPYEFDTSYRGGSLLDFVLVASSFDLPSSLKKE